MNLKNILYNNNLFYLAAIEGNSRLVQNLVDKGYPKSINDIPRKIRKNTPLEELNKVLSSYINSTTILIKDLIQHSSSNNILLECLTYFILNNKIKSIEREYKNFAGQAFFYGNIEAFNILCDILGKEQLCKPHQLLWYIHQARRNTSLTKTERNRLTKYIEDIGVDWQDAKLSLIRWANIHRTLEDFKYFYSKRKNGLNGSKNQSIILRKELSGCIEMFLFNSMSIEKNLTEPVLDYIAKLKEFSTQNDYEGYMLIIRKSYKIAKQLNISTHFIDNYFHILLQKNPKMIDEISKSKAKVPQLNNLIDKAKLNKKLSLAFKTNKIKNKTLKI
jgi:hypothetical protein